MLISSHFIGFIPVCSWYIPGQGSAAALALPSPMLPVWNSHLSAGPVSPNTGPQISLMSLTLSAGSWRLLNPLGFPTGNWRVQRVPAAPHKASPAPGRERTWQSPRAQTSSNTPNIGGPPQPPGAQQARLLLSHRRHLLPQMLALLQSHN